MFRIVSMSLLDDYDKPSYLATPGEKLAKRWTKGCSMVLLYLPDFERNSKLTSKEHANHGLQPSAQVLKGGDMA